MACRVCYERELHKLRIVALSSVFSTVCAIAILLVFAFTETGTPAAKFAFTCFSILVVAVFTCVHVSVVRWNALHAIRYRGYHTTKHTSGDLSS